MYSHWIGGGVKDNNRGKAPAVQTIFSQEVDSFLRDIPRKLKATFLVTSDNNQLWYQCFEAVASSDKIQYEQHLLQLYLKTTDNDVATPQVEHILKILMNYLKGNHTPQAFGLVHGVIEQRLTREACCRKVSDKELVLALIDELDSARCHAFRGLVNKFKEGEYMDCANELRKAIDTYKQRVQHLVVKERSAKINENGVGAKDVQPSFGWIDNPTLSWLLDKRWLDAHDFKRTYSSLDEYIATMQKMWTFLTFYWGAAAFWPKCNQHGNETFCGNPLMHQCTTSGVCSRPRCHQPAPWGCYRRDHDRICTQCLRESQNKMLGGSDSSMASTDVYDASVDYVGDSKTLQCSHLVCRRPPAHPIYWQTSYRLQTSCLVAVIPIAKTNIALKGSDRIFWGEIVAHSFTNSHKEPERRKNGFISIRLLGKSDCSLFVDSSEDDVMDGQKIAIVDLRVFVPEVMSVLSTLSHPSFKEGLERVAFQNALLDSSSARLLPLSRLDLQAMINYAIHNSSITIVASLSTDHKNNLVQQIWSIPQVRTLDETQGIAFASALFQSLHTVQGPPGSGKVRNGYYMCHL